MRSMDESTFLGTAHATHDASSTAAARERDALCHVARVLVSDAAIQRAILANEELRAMLRAVDTSAGYPPSLQMPVQKVPLGVAPGAVGDAAAAPPAAAARAVDWGAELRGAAAAAAHEARSARLAAAAALRAFFADAADRIGTFFSARAPQRAAAAPPPQRVSLSLAVADDDDASERVTITLRVCDADGAARGALRADDAAKADDAACCADGDTHHQGDGFPLPPLLEAALVLAAAALAVLLLRGRGVSVRAAGAAARAAAARF
jgi:hypothetical protein